jgi:hypothetical protein
MPALLPFITLNGTNAVSTRVFLPYNGVWYADVDLDPIIAQAFIAKGPALLVIGTTTMIGTIDPDASGRFAAGVRVRVVGGGGGWDKPVPFQHFANPAQVLSTLVYSTTGAAVKEVVADLIPTPMGTDYVRSAGPASRVLADKQWHVDPLTGITMVGPRVPSIPDPTLEVLGFDPRENRIEASCDVPIMPGTPLIDTSGNVPPRWDGILTAVDVEHNFSKEGNRATVWVSNSNISRLVSALTNLVREAGKGEFQRPYLYRVIGPAPGGKVSLAPTDIGRGAPPLLPAVVWGPAGVSATYTPGTACVVIFLNGDPTLPIVLGFDSTPPLTVTVDAVGPIAVGVASPMVNISGGGGFLAMGLSYSTLIGVLQTCTPAITETGLAAIKAALLAPLFTALPMQTVKTKAT